MIDMLDKICDEIEEDKEILLNAYNGRGFDHQLLMADLLELKNEDQDIKLPDWIDCEISNKSKYYNYNLALNPYNFWKE